jgi:hypothetical protein
MSKPIRVEDLPALCEVREPITACRFTTLIVARETLNQSICLGSSFPADRSPIAGHWWSIENLRKIGAEWREVGHVGLECWRKFEAEE